MLLLFTLLLQLDLSTVCSSMIEHKINFPYLTPIFCKIQVLVIFLHMIGFLYNSETVKFGHVTFFWNGNRSGYFNEEMEEYVEIPSDVGITFNVQPKMKALEIAEKAREAILSGKFDQVINATYRVMDEVSFQIEILTDMLFHMRV
jgi:hypothetical protein